MAQKGRPLPAPRQRREFDDDGYMNPVMKDDNPYESIRSTDGSENDKKIVVKQLPRNVTEETLQLYFESKRHQGRELEVIDVELQEDEDWAVVTFDTSADVKYVLERHSRKPCVLNKQTLVLELMDEKKEDTDDDYDDTEVESSQNYSDMYSKYERKEDETDTIEVRGFLESIGDDTLEYYFENKRRSGGGEIKTFTLNRDKGFVHITFKELSVVKDVLARKHVVESRELSVNPFIISRQDLLLENLPDEITEEHVLNYIEAKLKVSTTSVVFNQNRDKALVQFAEVYDFTKAQKICDDHKLSGKNVTPIQVPVSNCVIVYPVPEDVTHDGVEVYFENTKRSQGDDTTKVELYLDQGYCLVYFKDFRVVPRVCQKKDHKIHSCHVDVRPYNEYLGLPDGCEIISSKTPEPVSLEDFNQYKIKFLKSNEKQRDAIEKELGDCHAEIVWGEEPIVIECRLNLNDNIQKKQAEGWATKVRSILDHFAEIHEVREMTVEQRIWDDVMKELSGVKLSHPDGVALVTEKHKQMIVLAAHKGLIDDAWETICEAIQKVEKMEKEKKETTTDSKPLEVWKIRYLKSVAFDEEMQDKYKNIEIKFEEQKGRGKLIVTGAKSIVQNVWIDMYVRLEDVIKRDVPIGTDNVQLLQNEKTRKTLQGKLMRKNLSDVFDLKPDSVVVYADDENSLSEMEGIVNKLFAKLSYKLDSGLKNVLQSDKWKSTEKSLHDRFPGCLIFKENRGQLEIFTLSDIKENLSDELQRFMHSNAICKEELSMSSHVVKFIQHVQRTKFENEVAALKRQDANISITLDDKNGSVTLEGTSESIKQGKRLFQTLESEILKEQHTIKRRKVKHYMACNKGQECLKKVENNTPCVIKVESSGFKKSWHGNQKPTMSTFDKPTTCAEATLKNNVKLMVIGGDITSLDVDVLVNAANRELKHSGGLAAVIINKGGREIQKDCDDRIQNKGSVGEGCVFMGKSGKLGCKAVAHAVGPHWKGGNDGEDLCLQKAVFTCLEKSEKRSLKSIAMPALSAGMFHYPVDMACMEIVKAVNQHFEGHKSTIKEVYLCDINKATVQAFSTAVQKVVLNTKVLVNIGDSDSSNPAWLINTDDDRGSGSRKHASGGSNQVDVVKGELVKESVDVVVNSTSPDLQLKKGASSRAILKAAGPRIQQECEKNYSNGITVGEVAVTSGGKMKCSNIFHIAVNHFDDGKRRECLKGIADSVASCLEEADTRGHKSVSFPAMGTGAQSYPKDKVAKEMFKAVYKFFGDNPRSSIKSVRFVIYTEDDDTYEVFVTEAKNWGNDSSLQRRPSSRHKQAQPGAGKLVDESARKASFKFGNTIVKIYEGDITVEDSEAIVASCNLDLDLTKGAVTKALLKKGGNVIEQECKQQVATMKKDGIAVTTAGKLNAKYIIHVDTKYKSWEWKPVLIACLRKAEKHKFPSIALPAFGTSVGCKPEELAEVLYAALSDFLQDNPKYLKEIRLVIFQQAHILGFINGMKASIKGQPSMRQGHTRGGHRQSSRGSDDKQPRQHTIDEVDDTCTVTIYADTKENIEKAKEIFKQTVKAEWEIRKIEDEGIHRLSPKNKAEITKMAKNFHVEVDIDTDVGKIEVIGLVKNVFDVFDAIHAQLRSADNSFFMKDRAQMMSNIVRWLYLKDQKDFPFPDRINLEIETAYKNKEKSVKVKDRSGGNYEIDFSTMQEVDLKNPNNKPIPVIRRDLISGASLDIPKHWKAMNDHENLALVSLPQGSNEYNKVQNEFQKTLGGTKVTIVRIDRIQNKTLFTQYSAKHKEMNMRPSNKKDNERVLWHGTAEDAVQSINSHGFNRSYCGKNATAFGDGVYFAVESAYSNQSTYSPPGRDGYKRMYRCLVLTGKYTTGRGGMRVPPPIDAAKPHILYDSVTNNTSSPAMFIVFNDTQAYPEHIIVYK